MATDHGDWRPTGDDPERKVPLLHNSSSTFNMLDGAGYRCKYSRPFADDRQLSPLQRRSRQQTTGAQPPAGHDAPGAASALQAKDDVYDALDVIEALRVQLVGYFDVVVGCSGDFECKACGCKLKEPQRKVPGVGIVIVCLDIADTFVIILELTLNDEIVAVVHRGIEIINTRGSQSNETWKYSSPDSPTDTFFA